MIKYLSKYFQVKNLINLEDTQLKKSKRVKVMKEKKAT